MGNFYSNHHISFPGPYMLVAKHNAKMHLIQFQNLKENSSFIFTASSNGLSETPCSDTADTYLALVAFLSHGGKFHTPFLLFLTLKTEACGQSCQVSLIAGAGTWSPQSITSSTAYIDHDFFCCPCLVNLEVRDLHVTVSLEYWD